MAPYAILSSAKAVDAAFEQARAHGNEGIVAKRAGVILYPRSARQELDQAQARVGHSRCGGYCGGTWTRAAELGAVGLHLCDTRIRHRSYAAHLGQAYNGLTDLEIAELTARFKSITIQQFGRLHTVRPEIVLEVAFDIVQMSRRHKAGYALRFPRIVRVRDDKPATEIDTLQRVKELAGDA